MFYCLQMFILHAGEGDVVMRFTIKFASESLLVHTWMQRLASVREMCPLSRHFTLCFMCFPVTFRIFSFTFFFLIHQATSRRD